MSTIQHNSASTLAACFLNENDGLTFERRYQGSGLQTYCHVGDWEQGLDKFVQLANLDVLIVQIKSSDKAAAVTKLIKPRLQPKTHLILIGDTIDVSGYRQLLSLGCSDYLTGDVEHDQLGQIVAGLTQHDTHQHHDARGVLVWGVKGGVGSTTLTAALAYLFAKEHHRYTLAIDTDLYTGNLGFALNEDNHGQLSSLLTYVDELDDLLVKRSIVSVQENLSLLNDSLDFNQTLSLDGSQFGALAEFANDHYSMHVWDGNTGQYNDLTAILAYTKVCVLVCDLSMSSARALAKALAHLEHYPHVRPLIVINATRKKTHHWFTIEELEQSLNVKVDYQIPFADSLLIKAHEQGEMAITSNSSWAKAVHNVAADCLGLAVNRKRLFSPKAWLGGKS